jgi:hypothetical protein
MPRVYSIASPSRAGIVIDVQRQVHEAEAQLPHLRVGAAEIARAHHLLEQIVGDRLAGLVVAREQVQRLALPAPVLHDLRGQFHEIPGHAGARQAADLHAAQQVMQQVPELVEDGGHFACVSSAGGPPAAASGCRRSGPGAA